MSIYETDYEEDKAQERMRVRCVLSVERFIKGDISAIKFAPWDEPFFRGYVAGVIHRLSGRQQT